MNERVHFYSLDLESVPPDPEQFPGHWMVAEDKAKKSRSKKDAAYYLSTDVDTLNIVTFVGYSSLTDEWLELTAPRGDERDLIAKAWQWIMYHHNNGRVMITFGGKSFDLPAMLRRAMILDVFVPPAMVRNICGRYAPDRYHLDLMQTLATPSAFSNQPEIHNFDYCCDLYGLPLKPEGWDGSKVWPAFQQGWLEDILLYNRSDVERLNMLFRRVSPWIIEDQDYVPPLSTGIAAA